MPTALNILLSEEIANLNDVRRRLAHHIANNLDDEQCAQLFKAKEVVVTKAVQAIADLLYVPVGEYEERRRAVFLLAREYFPVGITTEEKKQLVGLRARGEEKLLEELTRPDPVPAIPSSRVPELNPVLFTMKPAPSSPPTPKPTSAATQPVAETTPPPAVMEVIVEQLEVLPPQPSPPPPVRGKTLLAEQIAGLPRGDRHRLKRASFFEGNRGILRSRQVGFYDLPFIPQRIKRKLTALLPGVPRLHLRRAFRELSR